MLPVSSTPSAPRSLFGRDLRLNLPQLHMLEGSLRFRPLPRPSFVQPRRELTLHGKTRTEFESASFLARAPFQSRERTHPRPKAPRVPGAATAS